MAKKKTSLTRIIVAVVFGVLTLAFVGIYIYSNVKVLTGGDQFWQDLAKAFRDKRDRLYIDTLKEENIVGNRFRAAGVDYDRELLKQIICDLLCNYTIDCYDHEYCPVKYGDTSSFDNIMDQIDDAFNGQYGVLNDARLLRAYISNNVEHDDQNNNIKFPIVVKHDAENKFDDELLHIKMLNGPV